MKVDECIALDLPQDKRVSRVKAASFHPIQNKIAIGFRRDIYEYDLVSGSRVAQYTTESEITHLAHAHTHNVLIAALKNGCFSALDLTSHTLTAFHVPIRSTEKRSVSYFAVSRTRPFIFYVRDRALAVCGIEMFADSKNRVEYAHKKPISCITTHPTRNIMASGSIDGNVRIWDTASHTLLSAFDEIGSLNNVDKSLRSPVTGLCFYSSKDRTLSTSPNNSRASTSHGGQMTSRGTNGFTAQNFGSELLITGTKNGRIQVWYIAANEQRVVATINLQEWIVDIFFHATLPCLMVLNHKGCLKAINIGHLITNFNAGSIPSMKGILTKFDMVDTYYAPLHDTSYLTTQKHLQSLVPAISARMNENSGVLVFCGKNYQVSNLNTPNMHGVIVSEYFPVFNTVDDSDFPVSTLPQCSTLPFTLDMVLNQKLDSSDDLEFEVPISDLLYVDTFTATPHDILMKYNMATDTSAKVQLLKINSALSEFHRCIQVKCRTGLKTNQHLLIFYEKQRLQSSYNTDSRTRFFLALDLSKKSELPPLEAGKDGDFLEADNPNNREFYILEEDGITVKVYELGNPSPIRSVKLAIKISRVFSCPFRKNTNLYYNRANALLGFANDDLTFGMSKRPTFDLRQNEVPVSVQWQQVYKSETGAFFIALLTTHRVLILDQNLNIRAFVESPNQTRSSLYFQSCLWLGNILLYNTCSAVYCLCPNMLEQTSGAQSNFALCTLEHANSVLSGVLYDRIFFTCYRNNCPQMSVRYVNIVEPLLLSIISLETTQDNKLKMMQPIMSKFDCRSVSEPTLLALEKSGFADLASELIIHSVYDFSWEIRFRLALRSLQFEYAFEILRAQYQRTVIQDQVEASPTTPQDYDGLRDSSSAHQKLYVSDEDYCTEKSAFYDHFVDLAQLSIEYAYYSIAAKCYDITNNSWALFKLFSMYAKELAVIPLSRLAMRCKNSPDLYTIYMACRVVLADAYNESEEDHIFNLFNGTFGKKRLSLELHTLESIEWRKQKESVSNKRSYDLGTSFKAVMKIKEEKKVSNDPTGLAISNLAIDHNIIEPLSMNNFSQWMGYNTTETKKLDQDWDRVDFTLSDFGSGARPRSTSSAKSTPTKIPSLPSLPSMSSLDLPTSGVPSRVEDGMETDRDADGEDVASEATPTNKDRDEDGFAEQPDLDKIRKQYMGGSSSDQSSDEDGDGDTYRKKRKLFRKLKIKDKSEASTPAKVDFSAFKLSGPGNLGVGGPSAASAIGGPAATNPRASLRRARGRTTTVVADVSPVLGSQVSEENTESNESATATDTQSDATPTPQPQVSQPTPSAPVPKKVSIPAVNTLVNPAESLKKGMALMEAANYREAKQCVNDAIVAMINDNSEVLKKTNLLLCVRYKLLIMMLANNQRIEGKGEPTMVQDLARNSFLLSQIKLVAKHQVICRNMSCKRNLQAQNFGIAARSIRLLLPVTPPQHLPEMQQRLKQCEAQNLRNENKELEEAVTRAEQDISSETDQEYLPIRFCWRTFELVKPAQPLCACPYCDATFLPVEGFEEGHTCSYCYYGTLESRMPN